MRRTHPAVVANTTCDINGGRFSGEIVEHVAPARPGRRPRPGGAVRGGEPRLPARLPRLPGGPRTVLGRLVHLRPLRGGRVHRAVRLLARPGTGAPGLATRRPRPVRAPAGPAHRPAVLGGPRLQPRGGVARRPAAGRRSARREVGGRQRPAGAEPRGCADAEPVVLVDRRRGAAVRRASPAAAGGAPVGRRRDGRRRDARRRDAGDRGTARRRRERVRDPVSARPRGAVRGRRRDRRDRGVEPGSEAVAVARARRGGSCARRDLAAGLGADAGPPALGRPRAGPGRRVPPGRPGDRPSIGPRAPARGPADPRRRPVVLQPLPDARPDRHRRLRQGRGRPGSAGRSGVRHLARPGAAADDRLRARLRGGLRGSPRLRQARPDAREEPSAGTIYL